MPVRCWLRRRIVIPSRCSHVYPNSTSVYKRLTRRPRASYNRPCSTFCANGCQTLYRIFAMEGAMLVLTRKLGESIAIDDRIIITVVALKGNQVKLGIDAPTETRIYRQEIYAKIMEANKQAATIRQQDLSAM